MPATLAGMAGTDPGPDDLDGDTPMTETLTTTAPRTDASSAAPLWRILAALAIAHVLVMFGSFGLQRVAPLSAGRDVVIADHVTHASTRGLAGLCLTLLAFLLLLVAVTLLGRLLRGGTELSGWLAATVTAAGAVYVAITVVGELVPLATALYAGGHGVGADVVVALVQLHWFALYGATGVLGVFTLTASGAVLATGALPRWVAWAGIVVGVVCLAGVPGAGAGLADTATALWSLWFVALGVAAAREPRARRSVGRAREAV